MLDTNCNSCILYFYTIIEPKVIISHITCSCAVKLDEFFMHIKYTTKCKNHLTFRDVNLQACTQPIHTYDRAQERTSIKGRWFKIPVKITDQILSLKIQISEKLYKQQKSN